MAQGMGRLLELGQLLRADSTANVRADMSPAELTAALREYKELKKGFNMSKAIKNAEKQLAQLEAKAQELGTEHGTRVAELTRKRRFLGEELLDGGNLEKLTGDIEKLEREIAALEQAAAVNQKRIEQARLALRGLVKNDALEQAQQRANEINDAAIEIADAMRALEPKAERLVELGRELNAIVSPYNRPGEPEPGGPTLYRGDVLTAQKLGQYILNVADRVQTVPNPKRG